MERVPYEMAFVGGYDDVYVEAELNSPLIDPVLLPSTGTLHVNIETESAAKKGKPPRFLLNEFIMDSLVEFLGLQEYLRATLEAELPRDKSIWNPKGKPIKDLWSEVKVLSLNLRRRKMLSPVILAALKQKRSPEEVERTVAAQDTPDTRTAFAIILDCRWDDEHRVRVSFRDGKFVGLGHE